MTREQEDKSLLSVDVRFDMMAEIVDYLRGNNIHENDNDKDSYK